MSNLKLLIQFAMARLEIQVIASYCKKKKKKKWIETGVNGRLVGEFSIYLLNITCLK